VASSPETAGARPSPGSCAPRAAQYCDQCRNTSCTSASETDPPTPEAPDRRGSGSNPFELADPTSPHGGVDISSSARRTSRAMWNPPRGPGGSYHAASGLSSVCTRSARHRYGAARQRLLEANVFAYCACSSSSAADSTARGRHWPASSIRKGEQKMSTRSASSRPPILGNSAVPAREPTAPNDGCSVGAWRGPRSPQWSGKPAMSVMNGLRESLLIGAPHGRWHMTLELGPPRTPELRIGAFLPWTDAGHVSAGRHE